MTYDLAGFCAFAPKLKLENGKPLALEQFQKDILADHFGQAVELIVVIPKKNYKTTTLAALATFHLHEVAQADIPVLASSRKQAGIMFRQAEKMIRNSGQTVKGTGSRGRDRRDVYELDGVEYEIRAGLKEIRANGGVLYVVANDEATLDGVIPSLGLIDELHRHRSSENYGLISDGLSGRKGRMVTISTAGASEESPLGKLRARAHTYRNRKTDGRHTRYAQGATVLHEWALLPTDDPENLKDVKEANPAKTQTLTELRRRKADPMMTPGRWLRFACGLWTVGDEPEIDAARWDALQVDEPWTLKDGDDVYLAPVVRHGAAIGIASMREDGKVAVRVEHITANGSSILERAEDVIVALCDRYRVLQCVDPMYGFQRSAQLLENRGVPMVEAAYSVPRRVAATGTFDRYLHSGNILHDGDPITREQVLHAQKKHTETGEHYLIDEHSLAITALSQAVHAASAPVPEAPEFGVL